VETSLGAGRLAGRQERRGAIILAVSSFLLDDNGVVEDGVLCP
jgi:hypothetical protein